MPFTPKNWIDSPSTSTPISAAALEDVETRVTDYTDGRLLDELQVDSTVSPDGIIHQLTDIGDAASPPGYAACHNFFGTNGSGTDGLAWQITLDIAHATPCRDLVIDRVHADNSVNDFFVLYHRGDANCPTLGIGGGDHTDAVMDIAAQSDHLSMHNLVLSNPPSGTQTGKAIVVRNTSSEDVFTVGPNGALTLYDEVANSNAVAFDPYNRFFDFYNTATGYDTIRMRQNGDSNPRFTVDAGGQLGWGTGSAAADTILKRSSSNYLSIRTTGDANYGNLKLGELTLNDYIIWNGAGLRQTTVGAAGGASSLPATPKYYLKVAIDGQALVIPAYLPS